MKQSASGRNYTVRKQYLTTPITVSEDVNNQDYMWLERASQLQMRRWWKIRNLI